MSYPMRSNFRNTLPEGKRKQFSHKQTKFEFRGYEIEIKENGRIVLREVKKDDEEYDEIEFPASVAYEIVNTLNATRRTKIVDKEIK